MANTENSSVQPAPEPQPEDRIVRFVVGPVQSNCYLYISDGECMIVDPVLPARGSWRTCPRMRW